MPDTLTNLAHRYGFTLQRCLANGERQWLHRTGAVVVTSDRDPEAARQELYQNSTEEGQVKALARRLGWKLYRGNKLWHASRNHGRRTATTLQEIARLLREEDRAQLKLPLFEE
jgi:hypothetical protein